MGGPLASGAHKCKGEWRPAGGGSARRIAGVVQLTDENARFVAGRLRTKREHGTKRERRSSDGFAQSRRKDKIMVQVAAALLFALAAGLGLMVIVAMVRSNGDATLSAARKCVGEGRGVSVR